MGRARTVMIASIAALVGGWWLVSASYADEPPHTTSFAEFLNAVSQKNILEPSPSLPVAQDMQAPEASASGSENLEPKASASGSAVAFASSEPWWTARANDFLLDSPNFLQFDLATLLTDTLESSPRISAISRRTSIAYEKIVQQDADFDPAILLETGINRINDPVGNTLTTGGPNRLIQDSWTNQAGVRKLTRQGTVVDLNQQFGTLTSNSVFFDPKYQGNSRLNLSITQPLLATSGRVYNTRLLTAASIDSHIAWQQLRLDLESHLIETLTAFWRLHERRSHLVQQIALIERGQNIGAMVNARADFDSAPMQRVKVTRRLATDNDRLIELRAEVQRLQVRLKTLVGSPLLASLDESIELIPLAQANIPDEPFALRDCIVRGLKYRADIQAATQQLSSAGLDVNVSRNELMPRLNAVFEAYLSGLNGNNNIGQSFLDQYTEGGPGLTAALTYNLPWGQRAVKSRYRESRYRYQQRSDELRDALLTARREIESSVIRVRAGAELRQSKARTLAAAVQEEEIAMQRWIVLAGDGGPTALILEDLLETQKRRTDAEQTYVSAQVNYVLEMIALQQAMGTFLIREGIEPLRPEQTSQIEIIQTAPLHEDSLMLENWQSPGPSPESASNKTLYPALRQPMSFDSQMIEADPLELDDSNDGDFSR
jgi:outer membrane protein TolC